MTPTTPTHLAELGSSIPISSPHALSVSLPLWQDGIGYEIGLERVHKKLITGYPRAFIHQDIRNLAENCRTAHALTPHERCMLFPTEKVANQCREFIASQAHSEGTSPSGLEKRCRVVSFETGSVRPSIPAGKGWGSEIRVFLLFVPDDESLAVAQTFWRYTGLGISSRCAERILQLLAASSAREPPRIPLVPLDLNAQPWIGPALSPSSHPARDGLQENHQPACVLPPAAAEGETHENLSAHVPVKTAQMPSAKLVLRRRIAALLSEPSPGDGRSTTPTRAEDGARELTEADIYLYPSGMSAIFSAHQMAMALQRGREPDWPMGKSICFGFPYTDTLKILEKWGPGLAFFGHGEQADLESLENLLRHNHLDRNPPFPALFCEFPSNPLLKSPDLARLRALADLYGFLIIIDDTIGNFLNVDVLPYADILVSSLTKVFSGDCTVMGGNLIVNPSSRCHASLKGILDGDETNLIGMYEDIYFEGDAIEMERNSRDVRARVEKIDRNAAGICEYLKSLKESGENKIIKSIHYPRYTTAENYERCRRTLPPGGYGGLFSLIFNDPSSCASFYDNLNTYKGLSCGTNFTLSCPYVILAHFHELDWAHQFGVEENLIRVSVGLEDYNCLLNRFKFAFERANL